MNLGQELNDETRIANYDLGQNSILNVVKINEKLIKSKQVDLFESALLLSTNTEANDSQLLEQKSNDADDFIYLNKDGTETNIKQMNDPNLVKLTEDKKSYFFCYCSARSCRKITKGKLRVKCASCKESTLIVEQRPCSFSDVLEKGRIKGKCQNHNCKGVYAEFYFKCSSADHQNDENNHQNQQDERALPLESIKHNSKLMKCPVCDEVKDSIFTFKCGHFICLDCFLMYCESKLNSRDLILVDQLGYTLNCPFDCTDSYIENCHYFHILSNRDYERFQDFGAEEYVLRNGGVICPKPNCSQAMLIERTDNCTKVCCFSCGHLFCFLCKADYHEGACSTDVYLDSIRTSESVEVCKSFGQLLKEKLSALSWNKKNADDVKIDIKRCPNKSCNCPTERESGCLHITCKMCNQGKSISHC